MRKISFAIFFFVVLIALHLVLFSGCKSNKNVENISYSKILTEEQQLEFDHYYVEALKEKMLKNYDKAEVLFAQCLNINNRSSAVYYAMADIATNQNNFNLAINFAQKAVRFNKSIIWYQTLLGELLIKVNKVSEATKLYEQIIEIFPKNVDGYQNLASLYSNSMRFSEAISTYNGLEGLIGISETVCFKKNRLYLQMNKKPEATEELVKLVQNFPDDFRYLGILAEFYTNIKEFDKAKAIYERILVLEPTNGLVKFSLANFYILTNEQDKAFNLLKDAFTDPEVGKETKIKMIYYNYPILKNDSSSKKAYELINLLSLNYPNDLEVNKLLVDYYMKMQQFDKAKVIIKLILVEDANNFQTWMDLLKIEGDLNDYKSILEDSNKAMELFPNQPICFLYNGIANFFLHYYKAAYEVLVDGYDNVLDNIELQKEFLKYLGEVSNRLGESQKSYQYFDAFLKMEPYDKIVLNNYSYYLSIKGDSLNKALTMIKLCIDLEPLNSVYLDTYAWVLFKMARYSEANKIMEKAMQNGGAIRAEVVEHYGDILFKCGELESAKVQWKKSVNLGSTSKILLEKISNEKLSE